ncbi:hypothetical protein HMPREF3190_01104 [Umbribacter vaginalis]|nr:hypothetical protein HMPREF3190_01104 [Coriobacteriales bacterium DNF00809]
MISGLLVLYVVRLALRWESTRRASGNAILWSRLCIHALRYGFLHIIYNGISMVN